MKTLITILGTRKGNYGKKVQVKKKLNSIFLDRQRRFRIQYQRMLRIHLLIFLLLKEIEPGLNPLIRIETIRSNGL